MQAIPNETLILESTNNILKLTTHRVRYYESNKKNPNFTSIMLDKISSVELKYNGEILLLIFGIILLPVVVGLILIITYFVTKTHVVSITPDGGTAIIFETKGMKREFLEEFIDKMEAAAFERKQSLQG